ncbi:O-methyltransferase [Sporomusa malonica]|uniref:tRNA 5-hydroxyuridine methyltransferase n=1 Tax=Sporomusa malonica TaxID=112901 RepID=A0A1W2AET3_9FIRM|nr:O-methyltransferase [Sporomusa malonica]SMC59239.1 Predicted O-methyltransferase YrrM [Sporomusa malonica]
MDNVKSILDTMEEYAAVQHVPIISREGGQLLQEVAAAVKPVAVLELGTAIGYSTLLLATTLTIGGKITTIEQDENRIAIAKQFLSDAGVLGQIKFIAGDAGEVVPQLVDKFDLVFIDAAKGQYLDYLHKVMDKLSPGAVVIADNVLFRGWVLDDKAAPKRFRTIVKRLKAYLEFVANDFRFKTTIHHIGDGMAVSYYQGETNQ